MQLTAADFTGRYETMCEEEFSALRREDLNDIARNCYDLESARRRSPAYREKIAAELRAELMPSRRSLPRGWTEITVSRLRPIAFPQLCPGCLRTEVSSYFPISSDRAKPAGFYVIFSKVRYLALQVPSCEACARRKRMASRIGQALIVAGFVMAFVMEFVYNVDLGLGSIGRFLLGSALCAPGIILSTYKDQPVRISNFGDEAVVFRFKLRQYADAFYSLNGMP